MAKNFFLKNAAQREIFFNIGQYFLVFWEKSGQYLVSILGKGGQYSGQYTDFFFTDHSCHHWISSIRCMIILSNPRSN